MHGLLNIERIILCLCNQWLVSREDFDLGWFEVLMTQSNFVAPAEFETYCIIGFGRAIQWHSFWNWTLLNITMCFNQKLKDWPLRGSIFMVYMIRYVVKQFQLLCTSTGEICNTERDCRKSIANMLIWY